MRRPHIPGPMRPRIQLGAMALSGAGAVTAAALALAPCLGAGVASVHAVHSARAAEGGQPQELTRQHPAA